MGKVRIGIVKRTARKLLSTYPDLFNEDFQHNKEVVRKLVNTPSKKLLNQIAGYITHLVSIKKNVQETQQE
ncbi:30S ribosomal protein S17e [Ignisphaera aggregans DSM 17230]|uniref:Small ribosomal subunit protein eS17 n=1 Tax=Ignisphaera aggregans (strain DSM 17230 / JCM 13409 / AQ1.S1) TaxID=583356 RepID=E0SPU2_IGNAA|nr:30S ribosomal protein S17e [Ignisphaera aggregans DSM 17230]